MTTKAKPKKSRPRVPRAKSNPYRANTMYGLCYDTVYKLALKKPVRKSVLLDAYRKASRLPKQRALFNMTVILSPTEDGRFHRSAEKASRVYFVRRFADRDVVQLVLREKRK